MVSGDEDLEHFEWGGDFPYFLIIELDSGTNVGIDLDTPWITDHADLLRKPSVWWLTDKETQRAVLAVVVEEGDQPYFTRHHVGELMGGREIVAIGLGKKRSDGTLVRTWIMPNGVICGGDDVDLIAMRLLSA